MKVIFFHFPLIAFETMRVNCRLTKESVPVIMVGVAFLLIFTAFGTTSQANESILEGARNETRGEFNASGYICLAIVYAACAICNVFSPMIVSRFSPKIGMFIGAVTYVVFLVSYFKPVTWVIYCAAAFLGCGAALLWTAHGVYITKCSNTGDVNRNFGIFWMLFQLNNLVGSTFAYFRLSNVTSITSVVRIPMFAVLTAICSSGTILLLFLPSSEPNSTRRPIFGSEDESRASIENLEIKGLPITQSPVSLRAVLVRAGFLVRTNKMIAILTATAFTGINLTFYSGVFGTCLSRMQFFGASAKSYIGLSGIFIGVGEIVGSQMTIFAGNRIRPTLLMLTSFLAALISMLLAFLMVPDLAPIVPTLNIGYITPSVYVAMFIAFLLGLVDSVGNTQISALIGKVYPASSGDTAAAFALFKFVQSVASAIAFFYSSVLLFQWQALLFVLFATSGMVGFFFADKQHRHSTTSSQIHDETPPLIQS